MCVCVCVCVCVSLCMQVIAFKCKYHSSNVAWCFILTISRSFLGQGQSLRSPDKNISFLAKSESEIWESRYTAVHLDG